MDVDERIPIAFADVVGAALTSSHFIPTEIAVAYGNERPPVCARFAPPVPPHFLNMATRKAMNDMEVEWRDKGLPASWIPNFLNVNIPKNALIYVKDEATEWWFFQYVPHGRFKNVGTTVQQLQTLSPEKPHCGDHVTSTNQCALRTVNLLKSLVYHASGQQ